MQLQKIIILCYILFSVVSAEALNQNILQKIIDKQSSRVIIIPSGTYVITKPIVLKSNQVIYGESVIISPRFNTPFQSVFYGENVSNVTIKGVRIQGSGIFRTQVSVNPYQVKINKIDRINYSNPYIESMNNQKLSIGFSNLDIAINFEGNCRNILIESVAISGVSTGILFSNALNVLKSNHVNITIKDSIFNNLGRAGVRAYNINNVLIEHNLFTHISGNLVIGNVPSISNSKWGDGISIVGSNNVIIQNNEFDNINRIGIVLEGLTDPVTYLPQTVNMSVIIAKNTFKKIELSKGSEYNAGIWIEPYSNTKNTFFYKTKLVSIYENNFIGTNSIIGSHEQYGIRMGALYNYVESNVFINFNDESKRQIPIVYSFGYNHTFNNKFYNCNVETIHLGDNKHFSEYDEK